MGGCSIFSDKESSVEVGISLDRIHKSKNAWGIIGLVAVISVPGSILQLIMNQQTGHFVGEGAEFVVLLWQLLTGELANEQNKE